MLSQCDRAEGDTETLLQQITQLNHTNQKHVRS